jgi:hypothetical protein
MVRHARRHRVDAPMVTGNGGAKMKNPLESLHLTILLGVILTAIMVLIIAIFYWDSGETMAPAGGAAPATTEGAAPAATEGTTPPAATEGTAPAATEGAAPATTEGGGAGTGNN